MLLVTQSANAGPILLFAMNTIPAMAPMTWPRIGTMTAAKYQSGDPRSFVSLTGTSSAPKTMKPPVALRVSEWAILGSNQ